MNPRISVLCALVALLACCYQPASAAQYRATCTAYLKGMRVPGDCGSGDGACDTLCSSSAQFSGASTVSKSLGEIDDTTTPNWNTYYYNNVVVNTFGGQIVWWFDCEDYDPWNANDDMGSRTFTVPMNTNTDYGSVSSSTWYDLGGTASGEFPVQNIYVAFRANCDANYYNPTCAEFCQVGNPPACTVCNAVSGACTCAVGYQDKDCGTCQSNYWPVGTSGQAGFQCVYCVDTNSPSACYTCQTGGVKSCCTGWKSTNCDVKKNCNSFATPPANSVAVGSTCVCTTYGCTCQYSCKSGFSGGSATTTCQNDETWSWSSTLTCNDIDECAPGGGNQCAQTCTNTAGDYSCSCLAGYSISNAGRGPTGCTDINECSTNNGDCGHNCNNTPGSYYCTCQPGWRLQPDGKTCLEIDECQEGLDNCDGNATCTNTIGSFECACFPGFSGDGTVCTDIDECAATPCAQFADCANFPGTFTCTCQIGYLGDGFTCIVNNTASFDVDSRFILFEEGSNSTNTTLHLLVNANSNRDGSLVYFDVIPTDALAGIDYIVETASPLVFNNGDTAHNISITIVGDNLPENVESIFVRLRDPLHLGIGPFNTSTVVIDANDNPNGLVRYVPASRAFSVNITAGSYPLVVERYSYSNLSQAVNVTISRTVPDVKNFTLIIPANKLNATINIPLPLSTVPSLAALYTYTITQAKMVGTGFAPVPGYYATSLVTINPHDDPHGVYGFDFLTQSVQEGTAILINLRRQRGTFGSGAVRVRAITLNSNQTGGVAIASSTDYSALNQLVTFGEGDSVMQISINAIADGIPELAEMFGVQLEFVSGLGRVDSTKGLVLVTIPENDDARGVLSVSRIYTCSEESPIVNSVGQPNNTVLVEVVRSAGLFGSISFTWSTHDGKFNNATLLPENWASAAQRDYVAVTGQTVTIPAGVSSVQIRVTLLDDFVPEMDEFLYVQLVSVTGGARIDPANNFTDICINRNDHPYGQLGFARSPLILGWTGERRLLVQESQFVTVTVLRVWGTFRKVSGVVTLVHETTTSSDFTDDSPRTVTFLPGQAVATVSWSVKADTILQEPVKFFRLELTANGESAGQEAVTLLAATALDSTIPCVIDAEDLTNGVLRFIETDVSVDESDGKVTLQVQRLADPGSDVTFQTDAVPITASGHDFDASNENNTHVLLASHISMPFDIRVAVDGLPEPAETFSVTLVNVTGAQLSWASIATVTILPSDDGNGVLEFAPSSDSNPLVMVVRENQGEVRLPVWREIGTFGRVNMTFELTVNRTSSADFAPLLGAYIPRQPADLISDLNATPYELVMEEGQNTTEIVLPIYDNTVSDGNRFVFIRLVSPGGGARLGTTRAMAIVIVDNEPDQTSTTNAAVIATATAVPIAVVLLLLLLILLVVARRRRSYRKQQQVQQAEFVNGVGLVELNPLHGLSSDAGGYDALQRANAGEAYDALHRPHSSAGVYEDVFANPVYAEAGYEALNKPQGTYDSLNNPEGAYDNLDNVRNEYQRVTAAPAEPTYDSANGPANLAYAAIDHSSADSGSGSRATQANQYGNMSDNPSAGQYDNARTTGDMEAIVAAKLQEAGLDEAAPPAYAPSTDANVQPASSDYDDVQPLGAQPASSEYDNVPVRAEQPATSEYDNVPQPATSEYDNV
ncbi:hypothetical protein CAOG_00336 [Capsaspora owczarzaki ATCC 30864]|uniref:Uncharacterized protein n=1 Tax=Capsaspora owczarzaki (strain ATCC 30864) TaxID=595528 RepID=A0A0D2WID3_CAPO3|nr:hypothetical protein CAOG_00336 [Capsaspora owczarzaki ATCC 30864]KJE88743.1 hypothetical protein CAOG_000336 [Capsaspora owczarzaki ATCC 30864]|eukprot:XP_004365207.1 hypothetical protein CAOG_00336 [Capsaspora owczarzaki ATCC 30864]